MNIFVGAPGREFLGPSEVFIILFVTFGPINFINLFYRMTSGADAKALVGLAVRSASIATVAIVLSAIVGSFMLEKWRISVPAIALTGGIVLFVAAMKSILALLRQFGAGREHRGARPIDDGVATGISLYRHALRNRGNHRSFDAGARKRDGNLSHPARGHADQLDHDALRQAHHARDGRPAGAARHGAIGIAGRPQHPIRFFCHSNCARKGRLENGGSTLL